MKTATENLENDHIYILKLTGVMKAITHSEIPDIEHIESIEQKRPEGTSMNNYIDRINRLAVLYKV